MSEEYDDEGSYAGVAELPGTEDGNDDELPEARHRLQSLGRKAQKAFMVAKEIKDSEKVFVNVLKLLNVVSLGSTVNWSARNIPFKCYVYLVGGNLD